MKNKSKESRLDEIRDKLEGIIKKNRGEIGAGKSIGDIEGDLLSGLLGIGKLLLEDRVIEEEKKLEETGYTIEKKTSEQRKG